MDTLQLDNLQELTAEFFAGRFDLDSLAVHYTPEQISAYYRSNIDRVLALVGTMSPEQLAYRLPGAPTGSDASGDEDHFDTSQIVTHLASGTTFHWRNVARALGHARPTFNRAPEGARLTAQRGGIMGGGGWADATATEMTQLLRDTEAAFLGYLGSLPPDTDMTQRYEVPGFANLTAHGWLFLAGMHSAMHLKQM